MSDLPPLHQVEEIAGELGLDACSALIFENNKAKGFWPSSHYQKVNNFSQSDGGWPPRNVTDETIAMKIALIHSEASEILEAVRNDEGQAAIVEEMADVIIRTLDLYAALKNTGQVDDSLDDVLQLKMKKNTLRPKLHGKRF